LPNINQQARDLFLNLFTDLGYRFFMRYHASQCFDTVLYAIPEP